MRWYFRLVVERQIFIDKQIKYQFSKTKYTKIVFHRIIFFFERINASFIFEKRSINDIIFTVSKFILKANSFLFFDGYLLYLPKIKIQND